MPAEVEAKFRAASSDVLDALAAAPTLGFTTLGPPRTSDEIDRYLDTADGRLARAHWACRLRTRDGTVRVSLKGPAETSDGAWHHHRPEIEGPASPVADPDAWPPSEARDRLIELTGGGALHETFALRQRRTERAVIDQGRRVGTLSLDSVEVVGEPAATDPLLVVELELADEHALDRSRFDELAAALVSHGLEPDPRTKLEHALERLAS